MGSSIGVVLVLCTILAVAIVLAWYIWWQLADVEIGTNGTIALVLGSLGSLILGMGLMRLAYWSHKHGFDARPYEVDTRSVDHVDSGKRDFRHGVDG